MEREPIKKATIALELLKYYNRYHLDSLNVLGIELIKTSGAKYEPFVKATYERIFGMFDIRKGFMEEGLKLLKSSRSTFVNLGNDELISEAFNETGICYLLMNDFERAKKNFNTSLAFGSSCKNKSFSYLAKINLAQCYYENGDLSSAQLHAEEYIRQALNENKFESIANAYSFLGQIKLDQNKTDEALIYFELQRKNAQKSSSPYILLRAKNNLAITKFYQGQKSIALKLFKEVLTYRKMQGVIAYICDAYLNLGQIYRELGENKKGDMYIDSSLVLTNKHGLIAHKIEALKMKMEHDSSQRYGDEIKLLRKKQIKIIDQKREERNLKKYVEVEQSNILNWPWYIYLIFVLIPFLIYLILKKD
tara:strand:- start:6271 stop:7362 length:1092 start_codon:yes stop_codon:yes gene_type:complete